LTLKISTIPHLHTGKMRVVMGGESKKYDVVPHMCIQKFYPPNALFYTCFFQKKQVFLEKTCTPFFEVRQLNWWVDPAYR
jgi:hypothetical protein